MFGCSGEEQQVDPSGDLTETLPDEVLQQVLSEVPALDLVESARLVCRRWRRLVSQRSLWRRVRLEGRVGGERELCRVLRRAPALAELALFLGDRVPSRCPGLVQDAMQQAVAGGLELRALALDWRHFVADPSCFHGILEALRDVLLELDVRLVGVEPVHPAASPLHPRPAPAFAALADLRALRRLRLRALFDPCWYFEELRSPRHLLRSLDVSECEPYLERLLGDLLEAHGPTLRALRIHARSLTATPVAHKLSLPAGHAGSLHALEHLALDMDHQDEAVAVSPALSQRLCRLTLAKLNRRLPAPDQDSPSVAVQSVCRQPWAALHTLELEDCLLSPADLGALLTTFSPRPSGVPPGLQQLVVRGGCFLGTAGAFSSAAASSQTRLFPRKVRCCPRDPVTGLYPLALES